jgi:hypothetical protein
MRTRVLGSAAWFLAMMALVAGPAAPRAALAAFELRDASPAALGAVSMDRGPAGFFEDGARRGLGFTASHASLYGVEGLTSEQAGVTLAAGAARLDLSHAQVGVPGVREHATRLAVREGDGHAVALSVQAERLVLALEGEPAAEVWTLGGGVRGRMVGTGVGLEIGIGADRVLRRGGHGRDAVLPAVPWTVRLRTRGASLEIADRWEGDGRTSPRLSLDVRAGAALALRFGRGERPGRTGAAAAIRVGRLEIAVGRQDDEHGGSVSSAAVTLLPGAAPRVPKP